MRVNRSAWMATALLLCAGAVSAQQLSFSADTPASDVPTEPKAPVSFDLSAIDKTADPCVDFYAFACGNWRKANPIPGDQSRWGRFNELAERNRYLLYVDLKAAADHPTSPLQRKYGDFFAACMNTDIAEQLGDKPLLPVFHRIEAMKDKKELAATVAWLEAQNGTGSLFRFGVQQDQKDSSQQIEGVGQGGITLPDRDYYLEANERMATIRGQYHDYIASIMKLTGDSDGKADTEATQVIGIETELAKGSMPRDQMRDPDKRYHIMTLTQLEALEPTFNWQAYFSGIHAPAVDTLNVGQPDFFTAENTVLTSQSLDALKAYLKFHAINNVAPWLSASYADANFNFFQKTLNGQAEQTARWKRCTSVTDRALGEAVGQDWVKQNFPPQAKQNMEQLVAALEKALGQDIQSLPWMTDDTKKQAEEKLADFRQKIGYPDKWRDYTPLKITRGDFVSDLRNSSKFEFNYDLNKVGKPVDEKEWGMTPPTVNAYYNPGMNDINFPAGILQPPFYDFSKDPAVNFGGIGVVIGHEMTHGFDDEGSKYDGKGNVKPWWTDADRKAFEAKLDCEVKEYGGFEPVDGVHLNGKLTLGENTADNGGIRLAYMAFLADAKRKGIDLTAKDEYGYTPIQHFFLAFGQDWCGGFRPQLTRLLVQTDPHSPDPIRANGVIQNMPEFGKAFGCKAGQPMMPVNACHVW
jgi:putative endopeptidase